MGGNRVTRRPPPPRYYFPSLDCSGKQASKICCPKRLGLKIRGPVQLILKAQVWGARQENKRERLQKKKKKNKKVGEG